MINYRELTDDFKRLVKENKLSHAYLFFGGDKKTHQEKFIFAQSLANFLENGIFEESEGLLRETLVISPDEKGTIGIDSIRQIKYFLWQKPNSSLKRLTIINEAENLTPEAQNAALKIVEEPSESGLIIFIAKTSENLLETLTSRLQKVYFPSRARINTDYTQTYAEKRKSPHQSVFSPCESVFSKFELDKIFEDLISDLSINKIKNSGKLKEVLQRLALIKQFNTNKKLQWRSLDF